MSTEAGERVANVEAADYMEDDPETWAFWIDALERYVPELPKLAGHLNDEAGAFQVIGGSILAYLADQRGLYLRRERAGSLDAAWATCEAALPEGWTGPGVEPLNITPDIQWDAWVVPPVGHYVHGRGPTPAAALTALAAALRDKAR